ncbi:MAG: peptidase domain-containing ABC transporter [Clostridiales bacterium]|jgi:ATP-binding cassette subfamily B protein|nr:peptidase domain-containing ABC transporter [Clostridiales bacterium]
MLKKRPSIRQHDTTDCAAACLATISKYYRLSLPISRIREIAGTDKYGTNAYGVVKAATELGFTAKAVKGNQKAFFGEFPLPCIAHVVVGGALLHYMVVYKISRKEVLVSDPAQGMVKYKPADFFKIWTGVLIVLIPNNSFKKGAGSGSALMRFFALLPQQGALMINIFFTSLLLTFLGILSSFYFKIMMDEIMPNDLGGTLTVMSIGIVALHVFRSVLSFFRQHLLMYLSQRLDISLILGYYHHVLQLPVSFFGTRKVGEIISRFTDASRIRDIISSATLTIMMDTIMAIAGGAILFNQNGTLFAITVVIALLYAVVVFSFNHPLKQANKGIMENNAQLSSYMVESLNGIESIKSHNAQDRASLQTEAKFIRLLKSTFKGGRLSNLQGTLASGIGSIGSVVILWMGASAVLKGTMSLGELLTFNALQSYFLQPIQNLINLQPQLQSAIVAADRLAEILDLSPERGRQEAQKISPKLHGDIEIKNLIFRYGTRAPVIRDVSMSIPKGSKIALVGESGSGKTTLAKLFLRFYPFEQGTILINGYNVQDISVDHLREKIGYISQEIFLFSGSIRENLQFAAGRASMDMIIDACKKAKAHDFINELPLRYETLLEENGGNLSGGQRQRLAIAQALLKKPDILIMDEATSSLDSITEKAIENMIFDETRNMCVIMIAHRLSTIMHCDMIYVMEKGKIIEMGRHAELMRQGGLYYALWKDQIPEAI